MKPAGYARLIVFCVIVLGALVLYSNREDERLKGPPSSTAILQKPGTLGQYLVATQPCPGYPNPVIVTDKEDEPPALEELLGDCDGDGYVDEISSPPPVKGGLRTINNNRQWYFILRPGVQKFKLAGLQDFDAAIYTADSPNSPKTQVRFERLRKEQIPAKKK